MKKNVHPIERSIRIVLGLILVSMAFIGPQNPWFLLGNVSLINWFSSVGAHLMHCLVSILAK